jgi:hypothetical protein
VTSGALGDDLRLVADAAVAYAARGEDLSAVIPTEPADGLRVYLCAFTRGDERSWIALDTEADPISDRRLLRDAVSIAAMCELAEETAGGGRVPELRVQLAELREAEHPEGIEEAEAAAAALEELLSGDPRLASPRYLDAVGAAARTLEVALGDLDRSPFAEAMKQAGQTVDGLAADIERRYKLELR